MSFSLSIAAGHRPALRSISAPAIGAHLLVRPLQRNEFRAPTRIMRVRHYIAGLLTESFELSEVRSQNRSASCGHSHFRDTPEILSVARSGDTSAGHRPALRAESPI